jgi:hypothetical protein
MYIPKESKLCHEKQNERIIYWSASFSWHGIACGPSYLGEKIKTRIRGKKRKKKGVGNGGVTWYLCWLILSTTGHHLDPTVVKNMSTQVCQDSFFLTYFGLFVFASMFLLFSLTLIIIRSCVICFVDLVEHKMGDAHDITQGQRDLLLKNYKYKLCTCEGNLTCQKKCFSISKYLLRVWPQIGLFIHKIGFFIHKMVFTSFSLWCNFSFFGKKTCFLGMAEFVFLPLVWCTSVFPHNSCPCH